MKTMTITPSVVEMMGGKEIVFKKFKEMFGCENDPYEDFVKCGYTIEKMAKMVMTKKH